MIVLSLFDGIACGYEAFKRAGIPVTRYYASEVDPYAMKIALKNHPDIVQLGDILNWEEWDIPAPDIIIGGSPCQGFSIAGLGGGLQDPRSALILDMLDVCDHFNPRFKLLENVKMGKKEEDYISYRMGTRPVQLDSSLVSAQLRKRMYWFNWDLVDPIEDKGILLSDILLPGATVDRDKSYCIDASYYKGGGAKVYYERKRRQIAFQGEDKTVRHLTPVECERLQTLPDNYTEGVSNTQRYKMIGNGWTVDVVAHILRSMPV